MIDLTSFTLKENVDNITLQNVVKDYTNESYISTTLDLIIESKKEYNNASKILYKSIAEAKEYEVINESFSGFFTVVKEIIDRFLKLIKSLFERFITLLHKMVKGEKHLLKHEKTIRQFNSNHEFDIEGYEYTIYDEVPIINAKAEFNKAFVNLDVDSLKNTDKALALKYISDSLGELKAGLDNYYDSFRGEVIGQEHPISKESFVEELFMVFRNGYDGKSNLTIDVDKVNKSLACFKDYKRHETDIKKIKNRIDNEYQGVKKSIDHMISRNRDNDLEKMLGIKIDGTYTDSGSFTVTEDILSKLNAYVKASVDKVEEMSIIHSLAFSSKLDAIKDCYIQDKKILYTALNNIQKDYKGDK